LNFRTLDLNLLRVFDVVMVERNVTRAADRLAMTQPAVSNALRRLREAIGDELFVPGSTGVTPTPQAVALWPAVRDAMSGLRELFDPQGFDPALDERRFTLAMADATAAVILPPLLARTERTRIALQIEPLTTRDPRALLERGAVDAAIGFFPDVARAQSAALGRSMSATMSAPCGASTRWPGASRSRSTTTALRRMCASASPDGRTVLSTRCWPASGARGALP
jgi:DNA-binding transcriptional LysR family regulator